MRITPKIFLFLWLVSIFCNSTSAASPLDIFSKYLPDIAVADIYQETKFLYLRVCNLGWAFTDSENTLVLAIKKLDGWIISLTKPVVLNTNSCQEFQIASIGDIGITTSGTYNIAAGALLKNGRTEKIKNNNKMIRAVAITFPSKNPPVVPSTPIYYNTSNSNAIYCTSSNNYCNTNNSSYCNSSNSYCNSYNSSSNSYYCNSGNNYCSSNSSSNYYRNNICPSWDTACNNSYYNSANTSYQNSNNIYCNSSNNYCSGNNNYNNSSVYYPNNYYYTNYCNSSNNYCNSNYTNNSYYCTPANNYCNTYNSNHYYNTPQYDRPDLVVQRVYQNSSDRHIAAEICNQGGDMRNSASVRTSFSANNMTTNIYTSLQLARRQCTGSIIYTVPSELGIYSNGNYYSLSVVVDANNSTDESNESNNTANQYLQIWTNY